MSGLDQISELHFRVENGRVLADYSLIEQDLAVRNLVPDPA